MLLLISLSVCCADAPTVVASAEKPSTTTPALPAFDLTHAFEVPLQIDADNPQVTEIGPLHATGSALAIRFIVNLAADTAPDERKSHPTAKPHGSVVPAVPERQYGIEVLVSDAATRPVTGGFRPLKSGAFAGGTLFVGPVKPEQYSITARLITSHSHSNTRTSHQIATGILNVATSDDANLK